MDFLLGRFIGCLLGMVLMLFVANICRTTAQQYRQGAETGVYNPLSRTYWRDRYVETDDRSVLRFWGWLARYWHIAANICLAVAFLLVAAAAYWLILLMAAHVV